MTYTRIGTVKIEPPAPSAPSDRPISAPKPSASITSNCDIREPSPLATCQGSGVGELLAQHLAHDVARVRNPRICQPVVDTRTGPTCGYQPRVAHHVQMLRHVGIGDAECFSQ